MASELLLLGISMGAGFLGALLGLGGGMIMVPVLTLFYQVNIRYAIAASLISIIATSSGAAASYLKDSLTNLRLAVFLELGTVTGAVIGFLFSSKVQPGFLFLLFGFFLLFSAVLMLRNRSEALSEKAHPWAEALALNGTHYKVEKAPGALLAMVVAGLLSALLGIGSGVLKVIAMDTMMKIPLKVSSATSNFMIGVTASASAGAYFLRGDIRPEIASPVAVGILVGSFLGARVMLKIPVGRLRQIFIGVMVIISIQMILKGLR